MNKDLKIALVNNLEEFEKINNATEELNAEVIEIVNSKIKEWCLKEDFEFNEKTEFFYPQGKGVKESLYTIIITCDKNENNLYLSDLLWLNNVKQNLYVNPQFTNLEIGGKEGKARLEKAYNKMFTNNKNILLDISDGSIKIPFQLHKEALIDAIANDSYDEFLTPLDEAFEILSELIKNNINKFLEEIRKG